MVRTVVLWTPAALVIALGWLRLVDGADGARAAVLLGLALVPALLPRRAVAAVAAVATSLVALAVAFGVSLRTLRPFDDEHFVGSVRERADLGIRAFYDVALPVSARAYPEMRGLAELAIFAFALAVGLCIRARRPLAACAVLIAGAAWPATLLVGPGDLTRGALILACALLLLAGLRPGATPVRPALLAGSVLVAAALLASTSPAAARGGLVSWATWNPYLRQERVSVDYVWRSQYQGVTFPDKATTVFTVEAPPEPRYWRATMLDVYEGEVWDEALQPTLGSASAGGARTELLGDALMPRGASNRRRWVAQRYEINALRDDHLIAAAVPVAYAPDNIDVAQFMEGGVATLEEGTKRGDRYRAWSFDDRPSPTQLARVRPAELSRGLQTARYLGVWWDLSVLPFRTPGREAQLVSQFATFPFLEPYRPFYRTARRVVGGARTPYGAAVALETWFRSVGGFVYDEEPPRPPPGVPALVDFVTRSRAGYCQHYAGAMALMLRYLGIPARVAVGFTSGSYDRERKRWVVTDLNAHAWVEVYLGRHGWLPFDPTPGRGTFDASYTNASASFDASGAAAALAGTSALGLSALQRLLEQRRDALPQGGNPGGAGSDTLTRSDERPGFGRGALVVLALVGLFALAWAGKAARRRLRYVAADPRRVAAACRLELAELAADQRVEVPAGATLTELAAIVRARLGVDASRFAAAAAAARFGPPTGAGGAARDARRELRWIRRALRRRLPLRARALGVVSPRSLRLPA